jgi:hypothetical protein
MSKKNKALKQLLKSQMQANVSAVSQGRVVSSAQSDQASSHHAHASANPVMSEKHISEFVLIKKDIRLSLFLISLVVVCLFVIYFADKASPFLLPLANKIFKLI